MKVYPVVHINSPEVAVEQAEVALDAGADGVYLIDHEFVSLDKTLTTFNELNARDPESYIGVNLLGYSALAAMKLLVDAYKSGELDRMPDALWNDDALADRTPENYRNLKRDTAELHSMRYLGGIAFKYTSNYTNDPVRAAREVTNYQSMVDVVTTSGSGTGSAPSIEKIAAMKAVSSGPLAVASGISLQNIRDYKDLVDEVLVASSVETAPYSGVFVRKKLKAFIDAAHEL